MRYFDAVTPIFAEFPMSNPEQSPEVEASTETNHNIIVVDMGKKKRKDVKKLRRGEGKLMDRVMEAVANMHSEGTANPGDTVVVVVERKDKRFKSPFKW